MPEGMHYCTGHPVGMGCPVQIPADRIFCHSCKARRQEELALGISDLPFSAVGIVLDSLEVYPTCSCGGDATAPLHKISLLHRRWEWNQKYPKPSNKGA